MHGVGAALYPLGEFAVLEAANQRTVAVGTIVDVQKIVVWLNVETRGKKASKVFTTAASIYKLQCYRPQNPKTCRKTKNIIGNPTGDFQAECRVT